MWQNVDSLNIQLWYSEKNKKIILSGDYRKSSEKKSMICFIVLSDEIQFLLCWEGVRRREQGMPSRLNIVNKNVKLWKAEPITNIGEEMIRRNNRKTELNNFEKVFVLRSLEFILEARIPRLSSVSNSVQSVIICEKCLSNHIN